MSIQQAYNDWAEQYDTNKNRTRDAEAIMLRKALDSHTYVNGLEIGCGTGKNTVWLADKVKHLTAVDFSEEMLAKARIRKLPGHVAFVQADITRPWGFATSQYDLAVFSLVLEHIENLDEIFKKLNKVMHTGGIVYIGELHPFKQYAGTKARFIKGDETSVVECYTHHVSGFINAALSNNFELVSADESIDEDNENNLPRILMLLFKKKNEAG